MSDILIQAADLKARIAADRPVLLVDVRPEPAWRAGTLPGARSLDVYSYFISRSDEAGITAMTRAAVDAMAGIAADDSVPIVFFEQKTGMIAPRALWFHHLAGRSGAMILDGGVDAWIEAGGALTPGLGEARRLAEDGEAGPMPVGARPDLAATTDEILHLDPAKMTLLDVRRRSEFEGSFAHACCPRAGRIPGASFLFWEAFVNEGRYRSPEEIAWMAERAGVRRGKPVVTYCHRGARAATAAIALELAGFGPVRIFVGSWHEWAETSALPIETGPAGKRPGSAKKRR